MNHSGFVSPELNPAFPQLRDRLFDVEGDGFGLRGATVWGDRLFVFGMRKTYIINDEDLSAVNWGYNEAQWLGDRPWGACLNEVAQGSDSELKHATRTRLSSIIVIEFVLERRNNRRTMWSSGRTVWS